MIFWGLRLVVAAVGLGCLVVNWRVGLAILFCLVADFVTYVGGALPLFSVRNEVLMLLFATVPVGVIVAFGEDRLPPWMTPTIAAALLAVLRGSHYVSAYSQEMLTGEDVRHLLPGGVALVVTVGLGLFVPSALVRRAPRR
jgi:hypothetical protein